MTATQKVIGRECKFAIHIPSKEYDGDDLHYVKEIEYYEDGTKKPKIRLIKNFQRSFWITRPNKRNHKDKKEWEHLDNLLEKRCTQSRLRDEVARSLGMAWSREPIKKLLNSPYIYGTDITSTSLIKHEYFKRYPDFISSYSVATFDIETDVIHGTNDAIMATLTFEGHVYTVVIASFLTGISQVEELYRQKVREYIGEHIDNLDLKFELYIAEDTVDLIKAIFKKAHEWKPDFLAIWNMDFDIPRILSILEKYGVDPLDVIADPDLPRELRICKYKQGPKKKVTASGKVIPINPAAQWHTLECTSSFYVIDAMCSFKHIRLSKQEEPSYALDPILKKYLKFGKLKFDKADQYKDLKWHQFMQTHYKIEYMVYNNFDSISMVALENKLKDLSFTLPSFSATTDFWNFKSQPKKIADALFFFCREKGYILGSVGMTYEKQQEEVEEAGPEDDDDEDVNRDDKTLSLKDWIVTLKSHMSVLGLPLIEEDESILTNIRCFVYDSDCVSAYPSATTVANVSKGTTLRELISIEGIKEEEFRMQNMNFILGEVNAIEYCQSMFNLPKAEDLLKEFNRI